MKNHALMEKWQAWSEKFAALALRERLLIAVGILALLFLVWDFAVSQPGAVKNQALTERFENADRELKKVSAEEQILVRSMTNDPSVNLRKEVRRLQSQLEEADQALQQMSVGLVSARRLPEILHDVLLASNRLELIGMRHFAPHKLALADQKGVALESDDDQEQQALTAAGLEDDLPDNQIDDRLAEEKMVGVYKHAVRVTLKGEYFDVIDYLQALEQLEWRFYWDFISYKVERYPKATVTLEVYTLSTDKGVLGV